MTRPFGIAHCGCARRPFAFAPSRMRRTGRTGRSASSSASAPAAAPTSPRASSREPLSKALGQPVVVENRVGAGGTTAAEQVAQVAKDGYTALMMSNAHAVAPAMYKSLRYDSIADFQMVSMVGTAGLMLVTAPDFPGQGPQGRHRAREGQSRQAQLRQPRRRHHAALRRRIS